MLPSELNINTRSKPYISFEIKRYSPINMEYCYTGTKKKIIMEIEIAKFLISGSEIGPFSSSRLRGWNLDKK